jgi:hypothetical protein
MYIPIKEPQDLFTLDQSRALLGHILDEDVSASVPQEAKQRRGFLVLRNGVPDLDDTTIPSAQQVYAVSRGVFEQEPEMVVSIPRGAPGGMTRKGSLPSPWLRGRSLMSLFDFHIIQAIQRHCRTILRGRGGSSRCVGSFVTSSRRETLCIQGKC